MRPGQARVGAGVAALAGLWIAVYWWWDPSQEPAIRFDTAAQPLPPAPGFPTPAEGTPGVEEGEQAARGAQQTQRPSGQRSDQPPGTLSERSSGQPAGLAPEPAGVLQPDFYDYVVQEDDANLQEIAEKLLGDRGDWIIIAQSNPMQDPARLRPGQVWRVPLDEENLQGVIVDADGRTIRSAGAPARASEEFIEYVVQSGDSLSQISQRLYGTQRHARLLFELNRDRLKLRSEDSIRVGQTLRAPKSPPD